MLPKFKDILTIDERSLFMCLLKGEVPVFDININLADVSPAHAFTQYPLLCKLDKFVVRDTADFLYASDKGRPCSWGVYRLDNRRRATLLGSVVALDLESSPHIRYKYHQSQSLPLQCYIYGN